MAFSYAKLACALLLCMVVAAPAAEAAFSCGMVSKDLAQCLTYLKGSVAAPNSACCSGVHTLSSSAKTTADRQTACTCLKSTSRSIPGIVAGNAAALPGKCGVSVGYPISASVDCTKVH